MVVKRVVMPATAEEKKKRKKEGAEEKKEKKEPEYSCLEDRYFGEAATFRCCFPFRDGLRKPEAGDPKPYREVLVLKPKAFQQAIARLAKDYHVDYERS